MKQQRQRHGEQKHKSAKADRMRKSEGYITTTTTTTTNTNTISISKSHSAFCLCQRDREVTAAVREVRCVAIVELNAFFPSLVLVDRTSQATGKKLWQTDANTIMSPRIENRSVGPLKPVKRMPAYDLAKRGHKLGIH